MLRTMRDRVTLPCLIAGGLFVAEGVASPWMESHWGYHALNVPLSIFTVLAVWGLLRRDGAAWGKTARVGAWIALVTSAVAAAGGLIPLALEPTGLGSSPGILEGILHTFTLAVFLGLGIFGIAAALRARRLPFAILGLASGSAVVLALVGFDSPWVFLPIEALIGVGFAWLGLDRASAADRAATSASA